MSSLVFWILPISQAVRSSPALLSSHTRGFSNKTDSCRAGGKPTSYTKSGCFKISKIHAKLDYQGARAVTVDGCFSFCQAKHKKGMQFFGVTNGNKCFCADLHEGTPMKKCNTPCQGDKGVMCGGIDTVDMYVMFDCTPPTPEEKKSSQGRGRRRGLERLFSFQKAVMWPV